MALSESGKIKLVAAILECIRNDIHKLDEFGTIDGVVLIYHHVNRDDKECGTMVNLVTKQSIMDSEALQLRYMKHVIEGVTDIIKQKDSESVTEEGAGEFKH